MPILRIDNLTKTFGGLVAVDNVNIEVGEGELLGLIGPNGAGKTTIFNLLTGVYVPTSGTILFKKDNNKMQINGLKPHVVASHGISRTFQNIRLFKDLTVLDNLRIAMHHKCKYNLIEAFLRLPRYRREEKEFYEKAMKIFELVGLSHKVNEYARNLSYGEQRILEIARAIATGAKLIFLDEPAAGMNPSETDDLSRLIREIKKIFGLTIVLIEHDMKFVMGICERIYVLDFGTIIAEGKPDEIKANKRVIEAYLGEEVL